MTPEEKIRENEKRIRENRLVYSRCFGTEDGKKVLADLKKFCNYEATSVCEQAPNALQTMFSEGKRRVILRVLKMMEIENG
jgi:hypothetical protein